ncbi:MAG: hypothetical protein AAFV45_08505 [Pseudomonadota bacterium]
MLKHATALFVGASLLWAAGPAQARDVVVMGSVRADLSKDQDEVENPRPDQRFSAVELAVERGAVTVESVTIRFGAGRTQTFRVNRRLNRNSNPIVIDFQNRSGRFIDEVRVVHTTRGRRGDAQAVVQIAGIRAVRDNGRGGIAGRDWRKNWNSLGDLTVRTRRDNRDVAVRRDIARTDVLGIIARKRPVFVSSVMVSFRDGSGRRFRPDTLIRPGDPIYKINLDRPRRIQSINVSYRGRRRDRDLGQGSMLLLANLNRPPVTAPRPGGGAQKVKGWVLLGVGRAAVLSKDYDAIPIGRQAGRFRALRVTARRQDIRLYGMRVTYGNGSQEDIPLYGWVRKNQTSQPFDLKGRKRAIKGIEFRYRTKLSFKGSGKLEVEGLR